MAYVTTALAIACFQMSPFLPVTNHSIVLKVEPAVPRRVNLVLRIYGSVLITSANRIKRWLSTRLTRNSLLSSLSIATSAFEF